MVHYKHMLGWPITFKDLESIDAEYYNNLRQLQQMVQCGEDLSMLSIDFSSPEGSNKERDNDNFPKYLEACLKYRLLERVKDQLSELLLRFFDIIPEPLLTVVFDFQELELLMCGLPAIDTEDWKTQTEYSGDYKNACATQPHYELPDPCQWLWEVIEECDQELKARLLQFVNGTPGVPSRGFGVLQGNDGNVWKFTVHGVLVDVCLYPRAHTCFNRIDLPRYICKEDLLEKLKLAVTMVATGFDIE
jgi:HECT-domain (ubiquitin-transferase)